MLHRGFLLFVKYMSIVKHIPANSNVAMLWRNGHLPPKLAAGRDFLNMSLVNRLATGASRFITYCPGQAMVEGQRAKNRPATALCPTVTNLMIQFVRRRTLNVGVVLEV
jgi:hypothetical protein